MRDIDICPICNLPVKVDTMPFCDECEKCVCPECYFPDERMCAECHITHETQEPYVHSGECVECGRYSEQLLNGSCKGCVMQAMLDAQQ